jgi:hypothetical protein
MTLLYGNMEIWKYGKGNPGNINESTRGKDDS